MTAAPTTINFAQIRAALTGTVKYAPLGTALPTDVTTAWNAGWIDLGTIDDKGVTSSHKKSMTAVKAWQSSMPVRQLKSGDDWTYKLNAIQMNWAIKGLWSDAGPTTTSAGISTLTVPANAPVGEYMFGIEWHDGIYIYREFTSRGVFTDAGDITYEKGAAIMSSLTYETLPIDTTTSVITTLSNDPAMVSS